MGFTRIVGVTALLVVVLAFYARPRFPDTATKRGLKTINGLFLQSVDAVFNTFTMFGYSSIDIMKACTELEESKPDPDIQEETITMDGVEVMIFRPAGSSDRDQLLPGIIHIHGGGWIILSPVSYAPYYRHLIRKTGSVVVSINYRLAPEHIFPVPFEDCLRVVRYFLNNAEKYGVDADMVGIKGDSAGGNLAMAVALNMSTSTDERPGKGLKFMSLDYPALQLFDLNLPAYKKYEFGPCYLNKRRMVSYFEQYMFGNNKQYAMLYNNEHISDELKASVYAERVSASLIPEKFKIGVPPVKLTTAKKQDKTKETTLLRNQIKAIITNPMFAPLMASDNDLAALPPSYVTTAEFDVLRDDGIILVERLKKVGVPVQHSYHPGEEHGFLSMLWHNDIMLQELDTFAEFFKDIVLNS